MFIVSVEETERIFKRFIRIDADRSGGVDTEEFMKLDKMADNPIASRFIELFDADKNGTVDFHEFLHGLSIFGRYGYSNEKIKCEMERVNEQTIQMPFLFSLWFLTLALILLF